MGDTATACYRRVSDLLQRLEAAYEDQAHNVYFTYSRLWQGILTKRPRTERLNDLLTMLNAANRSADGVAGTDLDAERLIRYYRNFVTAEVQEALPLSMVGTPTIIDFDGVATNVPYIENVRLHEAVRDLLRQYGRRRENLRVAEIGAGYGGLAALLLHSRVADSYTVIDLPDNLTLSAFYLTEQYPHMPAHVHSHRAPVAAIERRSLNFVAAGHIDALAECRFDLVINTDSLGEMAGETARAYVGWIADHLDDDGFFYSKNGHRRTSDGVTRVSQLGYDRLALLHLQPRRTASGLFHDHGHEALLTRRSAAPRPQSWAHLDTLCNLYAIGLRDELIPVSAAFVNGELTEVEDGFLMDAGRCFAAADTAGKLSAIRTYPDPTLAACAIYLRALVCHVAGRNEEAADAFRQYLRDARSPIAEATGIFALAQRNPCALPSTFAGGGETQFLVDEVAEILAMNPVLRRAAFALRNEILRKKLTPPERYRPSTLLQAKNVVLNVRDGRGLATERY